MGMPIEKNVDEEVAKLKSEAVGILRKELNNFSSPAAERFVDCIVSAAMLETVNIMKQVRGIDGTKSKS